jgi:hypothetical protein
MSAPCRVSRAPVLNGILLIAAGLPSNGRLHYSIVCAPLGRIVGWVVRKVLRRIQFYVCLCSPLQRR